MISKKKSRKELILSNKSHRPSRMMSPVSWTKSSITLQQGSKSKRNWLKSSLESLNIAKMLPKSSRKSRKREIPRSMAWSEIWQWRPKERLKKRKQSERKLTKKSWPILKRPATSWQKIDSYHYQCLFLWALHRLKTYTSRILLIWDASTIPKTVSLRSGL